MLKERKGKRNTSHTLLKDGRTDNKKKRIYNHHNVRNLNIKTMRKRQINLYDGAIWTKGEREQSVVVADKITKKKDFLKRVDSLPLRTYLRCIVQDPQDTTRTSRNF